ncbi:MAG: phage tail protein [Chlorobiaceae bacterium]|nr:phage tail protein [Chlorobiaceae bacterium]
MLYMLLGGIGYARLTSPSVHEIEKKADYAEHQVTEGKPLLQHMGPALDELSFSFLFHEDFIDPQYAWEQLVDMLDSRSAFPVSMGNGELLGMFVLVTLSKASTVMSENGTMKACECQVSLKEWVDPAPLETRKAEKKGEAGAVSKPGTKKPKSKKATVPKVSKKGDYKSVDKKTIVRQ